MRRLAPIHEFRGVDGGRATLWPPPAGRGHPPRRLRPDYFHALALAPRLLIGGMNHAAALPPDASSYAPCTPRDVELIARLLGGGAPLAHHRASALRVLHGVGGLRGLAHAGRSRLAERGVLGDDEVDTLLAALALSRRLHRARTATNKAIRLTSPQAIAAWALPRLAHLEHEEVWALALNAQCNLLGARRVALGGLSAVSISLPKLLRDVVAEGARFFVLVHNHPSGDPTPSAEDVSVTARIATAAATLDVPLLDHVIIAGRAWSCVPFAVALGIASRCA
jgi:DNA repair protein RadC